MSWHARLRLDYRLDPDAPAPRTIGRAAHEGPLRVLQSLYPEGPATCHHVIVHPPGGIVGGDTLEVDARLAAGTHALVTTPGATRFYRSGGASARQQVLARVDAAARLEWLPLETLVHDGARAANTLRFELAPGASMIGWDLLALGLPAAGEAFARGRFEQSIELAGANGGDWLERGVLDFDDPALAELTRRRLASPLGFAGHAVLATAWCAFGEPLPDARRNELAEAARAAWPADAPTMGCTSPQPRVIVLRALAARVEPLHVALLQVWAAWRRALWAIEPCAPRVWRT
ncbi:urease accessory protein UreD [Caldimonas sp. KR1-144]|uniref:urease accessory protein UreD n=1 Tax=Caldimonas sp. KR1-144 TaxID=3400911 RepID=UPI003C08DEE5